MKELVRCICLRQLIFRSMAGQLPVPAVIICVGLLAGCGSTSSSPTPTNLVNPSASGNWQILFTAANGPPLFPILSGYVKDDESNTPSSAFTTAEMTSYGSGGCFDGSNSIFLFGNIMGAELPLHSASINGQFLDINGLLDSSGSTLSGTYQVAGGCANGASGTIAGYRISPLSGTYSGTIDLKHPMQLVLKQNAYGNGNGDFSIEGSALVSGISCFGTGTLLAPTSVITGASVQLLFSTSDASGAQLLMQGSVDAAADTINFSSIQVTSGICAGSYGTATFKL